MDTSSLQPLIQQFLTALDGDQSIQDHLEEHRQRAKKANELLQLTRISTLTRSEILGFLQNTDAWYGVRGKQRISDLLFGESEEKLPALQKSLYKMITSAEMGLTAGDFTEAHNTLSGIGPAFLSEILALRFPDRYWIWNGQVRGFFEKQEIDIKEEIPWGKKGDVGEEYFIAGKHLDELRRAISKAYGRPVDFLFNDLFLFWVNQQHPSKQDPLLKYIEDLRLEMTPERLKARLDGEERARILLKEKPGQFTEADLRQFLDSVNADWYQSKLHKDRFMPALYGAQVNKMLGSLSAFNDWSKRLWEADDNALPRLLDEFWEKKDVLGAGISLPSAILYLRNTEKYSIWLPIMSKGLEKLGLLIPGETRTADGYFRYNQAVMAFLTRYKIVPQFVDLILWRIANATNESHNIFPGFSEDTFRFLQELGANNTADWMHANDDANEMRYRQVLREPLRMLFETVAPAIAELDPNLETEVKFGKVMSTIKKRWPDDQGMYHNYLWGAFYRKDRTKQSDAQLFINVHRDHVNVGFSVMGARGADALRQFRENLQQAPEVFFQLQQQLAQEIYVSVSDQFGAEKKQVLSIKSIDDVLALKDYELIDIERRYDAGDEILFQPEFADEVRNIFKAVHPFFRFATTSDHAILESLAFFVESQGEIGDIEDIPIPYSREQLYEETYLNGEFWQQVIALEKDRGQIIFYGPPGTGKTFIARKFAQYLVENAHEMGGKVELVQFHPSYAYEEFIEGIRPQSETTPDGHKILNYPVRKGIFPRLCELARRNTDRHYVLIIDEINRGELPRIFGELLYLLEYRDQAITLPYSGESFNIPRNITVLGTMNTADRSIALVDHALRRRFHFVSLRPNPSILRVYFEQSNRPEMGWVVDLLELTNRQLIQDGVEWHLHVGHSHFMRPGLDEEQLHLIWDYSILPTLEEYFYRQPERLKAYTLDSLKSALGKP